MPESGNDHGDVDLTVQTAVKRSTGQVQRLTMDDEERLRILAHITQTLDAVVSLGEGVYSLIDRLADFQAGIDDILIELRLANAQRAEMGGLKITRNDVEE